MMDDVVAIVLAAGASRRMGVPKMVLPWGQKTVIGQVISVLRLAGLAEVIVVTGGAEAAVVAALQAEEVKLVSNPGYASGEMLASVQVGLGAARPGEAQAALIVLGDQPQVQVEIVRQLLLHWQKSRPAIIIPSYQMRRGHPWLIQRRMWPEIIAMQTGETLRDFLRLNVEKIDYLPVENDSILQDLDTMDVYEKQRPK